MAASAGSLVKGRTGESSMDGLWQSTHCSIWLRFSPCSDSRAWQLLQFFTATTVRRGVIFDPSTEKLNTLLSAPYDTVVSFTVPALITPEVRDSMPIEYVPQASAGTACANV